MSGRDHADFALPPVLLDRRWGVAWSCSGSGG